LQKFEKMAEEDKERYKREMASYVPPKDSEITSAPKKSKVSSSSSKPSTSKGSNPKGMMADTIDDDDDE